MEKVAGHLNCCPTRTPSFLLPSTSLSLHHSTMPATDGPERIDPDDILNCQRRSVYEQIQDHKSLLWLPCATTSLLTTRHLLVESNLHYPLQLYSWQISATAFLALISHVWRRYEQNSAEQEHLENRPVQATLLVAASHCLQAIAALCITQAVLHTSNLPLLYMVAVSLSDVDTRVVLMY